MGKEGKISQQENDRLFNVAELQTIDFLSSK